MNVSLIDLIPSAKSTVRFFGPGMQIFTEGEQPRGIYFVRKGSVGLSFGARGNVVKPLRIAGPGEILGLTAVVSKHANECSATAKNATEVAFVESTDLMLALAETPAAWLAVVYLLSNDVNDAYDRLRSVAV